MDSHALNQLRTLTLGPNDLSAPFVSAASGLVAIGDFIIVVADDEFHLGVFRAGDEAPGALVRLLPGKLPKEAKPRKKQKPDFEALVQMPTGDLLAIPSGSKPNRTTAAKTPLRPDGFPFGHDSGRVQTCDFGKLFAAISDTGIAKLNIESGFFNGPGLTLVHRGNSKDPTNYVIKTGWPYNDLILSTKPVVLPLLNGVPLTITDAIVDGNGIIFTAAAEETEDPYLDGFVAGSVVGHADADFNVNWIRGLGPHKIEGIARRNADDFLLVSDADDRDKPSFLFSCSLPIS